MYIQNGNQNLNKQNGLNRLITAAVVNRSFRQLLLEDPDQALNEGYNSESFSLEAEDREKVLAIKATSLTDLASQLSSLINPNGQR